MKIRKRINDSLVTAHIDEITFHLSEIEKVIYIRGWSFSNTKKNSKYSNVYWPAFVDYKTDISILYNGNTYFIDPSRNNSGDYDISACYKGETIYFKVEYYYPFFLKAEQKDGRNIAPAFVKDTDDEIFYLYNLDWIKKLPVLHILFFINKRFIIICTSFYPNRRELYLRQKLDSSENMTASSQLI